MSPTMEDVARQTGLSKSTVSLALNDMPGVAPETKDAVLQAADQLGYRLPERRPVKKTSSRRRNFVVVHHVGHEPRDEVYSLFLDYLHGIQSFAQEVDINITAIGGYHKGDLHLLDRRLLSEQNAPVDGLILMGKGIRRDSELLQRAIELQIPVVALGRNWPDLPVSTVSQDHCHQAKTALDHLAQLGHRRIAYVAKEGDDEYEWYAPRLRCYCDKMNELGQEVDKDLIVMGQDGADSVRQLLSRKTEVTAVFAIHDGRAIEAMRGAMEMGLAVPGDISVIGLDNSEEPPAGFPSLTTVGFSHFDIGYLGTELLLRQLENENISFGNLWIRTTLIERDSCRKLTD